MAPLMDDVPDRVADTLDVLVHDGYLELDPSGPRFCSRLLRDWWASRFRESHIALDRRLLGNASRPGASIGDA